MMTVMMMLVFMKMGHSAQDSRKMMMMIIIIIMIMLMMMIRVKSPIFCFIKCQNPFNSQLNGLPW